MVDTKTDLEQKTHFGNSHFEGPFLQINSLSQHWVIESITLKIKNLLRADHKKKKYCKDINKRQLNTRHLNNWEECTLDRFKMTKWIWLKFFKMTEKFTLTNINMVNMTEIYIFRSCSKYSHVNSNFVCYFIIRM